MNAQDKDPRGSCTLCANLRGAWCVNAKAADLRHINGRAEIGPALAALPQHCNGFKARVGTGEPA